MESNASLRCQKNFRLLRYLLPALLLLPHPLAAQVGGRLEVVQDLNYQETHDYFGLSFAVVSDLNGDGVDEILANAIKAEDLQGGVYLYSGADGTLMHTFTGTPGHTSFGEAVASIPDLDGDGYDDILIGTPRESSLQLYAGSVRVYSGFTQTLLYRLDGAGESKLGTSFTVLEDWNGDGYPDFAVGAPGQKLRNAENVGAVHIYSGADGIHLAATRGQYPNQYFGNALATLEDVNQDGSQELVVGSYSDDSSAHHGIHVYSAADLTLLYRRGATARVRKLGNSLAAAGDVNADGIPDFVTAASVANQLSALVLSGDDGSLIHSIPSSVVSPEFFGFPVVSGGVDLNRDGYDDILIGRWDANHGSFENAGVLRVHSGFDGSLLFEKYGESARHHFGHAVLGVDDFNGDGIAEAAASGGGSWQEDLQLLQLDPFLNADRHEVSASQGATVALQMKFPVEAAGYRYRVLFSAAGVGPTLSGVEIPLTMDAWFLHALLGNYPFPHQGQLSGNLSPHGRASTAFVLPPGMPTKMVDRKIWFAVTASPPGQPAAFSSLVQPLTIIH